MFVLRVAAALSRLRRARPGSTASASADPHVLAIALGNGWCRGRFGFLGNRAVYGTELAAIAQLEIEFADGHVQVEGTNASWRAGPSPVTANDLYDGQSIHARRQDDTWLQPGAPLSGWTGVHAVEFDTGRLTQYLGPVVRRQEELAPRGSGPLRPVAPWSTSVSG